METRNAVRFLNTGRNHKPKYLNEAENKINYYSWIEFHSVRCSTLSSDQV